MSKKKIVSLMLVFAMVFVTLALAGCGGTSKSSDTKLLKVGVLLPDTGGMATMGPLTRAAMKIAMEQYDDGLVAGRQVELYFEDTASDAAVGVQKAQKLIEENECEILLGPQSGSVATAVKEYAGTQPDVTFVMGGGGDTMTYGTVYENVFRVCVSGAQSAFCLGEYAYEMGYQKVITVAPDADFQYSLIAGFKDTFILAGGEVDSLWFPESGNDFSSMISQIPKDADAILLAAGGSNGADFIKQYKEYGHTIPLLCGHSVIDSNTLHNVELGKVVEGAYGSTNVPGRLDIPEYKAFNEKHIEELGFNASIMSVDPYVQLQVVFETLKAVNGDTSDLSAFRKAMSELDIITPRGPLQFDENRQFVSTQFIVKAVYDEEYGYYISEVVKEYPNQTQFGPFDPTWYAEQPLPGRDNPTKEAILNAKMATD